MEEVQTYNKFRNHLLHEIYKVKNKYSDFVFLCIGTSKVIGDSFGPFVGEFLKNVILDEKCVHVIGNIKNNVSYLNAEYNINKINEKFEKPFIIVIDSALSDVENIGKILVTNTSIKLGECMGKKNYKIGNVSIKGIVGENYNLPFQNFLILNKTPIKFVINLAKIVAQGIYEVNSYIKK